MTRTFYKRPLLATLGLCALLGSSVGLAQSATTDLLPQGRNFANLNDANFGTTRYDPAPRLATDTQLKLKYKGYVFGLRVLRANVVTAYGDVGGNYTTYADVKTSGLAALLKKMEIWAVTSGKVTASGLLPDWHVQQNTDKKNRRVEMNYDRPARRIDVDIVPPLGSQGVPAASPAERFAAHDTLSGIMTLFLSGTRLPGELCEGSVPMFDSKQHYNLRLERVGEKRVKFLGDKDETVHCHIYYEPVSGFDPEDLPDTEEAATPVDAYFQWNAAVGDYIPVRMTYKISSFKAVIKLDELEIVAP